jgi:hypothetical protein
MAEKLTDITMIVDRSGSMVSCREEAEAGVNHFITEQKKQKGKAILTLVQFDTDYEVVHDGVKINKVKADYKLEPRGMTALLDAVGRSINGAMDRISIMKKKERPDLVVFVIVTDGEENSSHEFTLEQIKGLITRRQKNDGWQFTFLGANQDAFSTARSMGMPMAAAASYDPDRSMEAFAAVSSNTSRMRDAAASGGLISSTFTDEERNSMKGGN